MIISAQKIIYHVLNEKERLYCNTCKPFKVYKVIHLNQESYVHLKNLNINYW